MKFVTLLNIYINHLENIQHRYCRGLITKEQRDQRRVDNEWWFHDICHYDDMPDRYVLRNYDELTDAEKEQYKNESYPLCALILYRNEIIPCYDDDYGQQVFAIIRGADVGGGAYNLNYAEEFCDTLDYYLEEEMMQDIENYYKSTSGE